jgi:hypothetical protein
MSTPEKSNCDADSFWMNRQENQRRTHGRRRLSNKEASREELLKSWYGSDEGRNEIMAHQTQAQHVGDVVSNVLAGYRKKDSLLMDLISGQWPQLIGADIARFSHPFRFQNGTLEIEVVNPAWLYVLEREHKTILEAKLASLTENKVRRVRFIPGGRCTPEHRSRSPRPAQ